MAANFIRSILGRFERTRFKFQASDQPKQQQLRASPQAEDISFHDGVASHQRTKALEFTAHPVKLSLIGFSVLAFGIALGDRIHQVDWATVFTALRGKSAIAAQAEKRTPEPLLVQVNAVSDRDHALRMSIPTPIQFPPVPIPLPIGTPLPIGPEMGLHARTVKQDVVSPENSVDVTLRSVNATPASLKDDDSVQLKPRLKPTQAGEKPDLAEVATQPEKLKSRAVAIEAGQLTLQSISVAGQIKQRGVPIGEKLSDGQTLTGLDKENGTYATESGVRSLWEPGQ